MITTLLFGNGYELKRTLEGLMSYFSDEDLEIQILFSGDPDWIYLGYRMSLEDFLASNFSRPLDVPEIETEQRYRFGDYLTLSVRNGLSILLKFVISSEDESENRTLMTDGVLGCDFDREFSKWAGAVLNAHLGGVGKLNHSSALSPAQAGSKGYTEERMAEVKTHTSPDQGDKECFNLLNSLREVREILNNFEEVCVAKVHGEDEDFDYVVGENRVKWNGCLPARAIRFEKNGLPSELFVELECAVDLAQKFVDFDRLGIPKPFLLSSWHWDTNPVIESVQNFLAKLNQEIQKLEPGFREISPEDVSFTAEEMERTLREGYHKYWPDLF